MADESVPVALETGHGAVDVEAAVEEFELSTDTAEDKKARSDEISGTTLRKDVGPIDSRKTEKEATDALLKAVEKIRALKAALTVDVSEEYLRLVSLMEEVPLFPDSPRIRSRSSSSSTDGDRTPRQISVHATNRSQWAGELLCTVQRSTMEDWRSDNSSSQPSGHRFGLEYITRPSGNGARGRDTHNSLNPVIQAFYRNVPSVPTMGKRNYSDTHFKDAHTNAQNIEKPQRIKINSEVLLDDLQRISGLTLSNFPHFIIPPFKILIHNWDGIKSTLKIVVAELEEMEKRVQATKPLPSLEDALPKESHGPTSSRLESAPELLREEKSFESPCSRSEGDVEADREQKDDDPSISNHSVSSEQIAEANVDISLVRQRDRLRVRASHLQCLHDFMVTDLSYLVGLRIKIKETSLEMITFEEVYHLYNAGDLIIDRENDVDLLYQVYAVTGGRMRLRKSENNNMYRSSGEEEAADNSPEAGVGTWTDLVIDSFGMDWDGNKVGPRRVTYRIPHYTGEKKITDLEYYPIRFRKDSEDTIRKLKVRGKRLLDCYGHKKYDAQTTRHPGMRQRQPARRIKPRQGPPYYKPNRDLYRDMASPEKDLESDVYVDLKTFNQTFPPDDPEFDKLGRVRPSRREVTEATMSGRVRDYYIGDHDVDQARSDSFLSTHFHLAHAKRPEELEYQQDHLVLLPHCVPAFDFRQREWHWLHIDKLEEIDKSDDAKKRGWEDLVIEDGYSQLLLSLVDNHTSAIEHKKTKTVAGQGGQTSQIDLIKGKGRGLILLLHGPPGTGKTSTAETIAAYTGKPLYAVTCGDIGVTAEEVEHNIREHSERAEKWGCVLLLDEADVFLAKRTWTDMNRNAVVSVFLRHLEYYSGILFLTTNIVGIIDEAFKSRIHVALRYDMINHDSTEKIWNNILDRILKDNEHSEVKIKFDRDNLLEFALSHYEKHDEDDTTWNARQIRNAFSTAIAMGQFDRFERIRKEGLTSEEAAASGKKSLMTIRLTKRNFAKIAETATDFERYINAVRGPDADNALASQQRDDYFARQMVALPRRKQNRGGSAEYSQGPRRQDLLTPRSSRSSKGQKAAERPLSWDEDDDEDEKQTSRTRKPRTTKEHFSDEDDEDSED